MRKNYNKLVRDRIPRIIEAAGKRFLTRVLSEDKYQRALKQKLVEEAGEVEAAESRDELVAELADVAEVMEALMGALGLGWDEVWQVQREKRLARGGFEGRVELVWEEEEEEGSRE